MKKAILILLYVFFLSCSTDELCTSNAYISIYPLNGKVFEKTPVIDNIFYKTTNDCLDNIKTVSFVNYNMNGDVVFYNKIYNKKAFVVITYIQTN
jgi:hypothetical protein